MSSQFTILVVDDDAHARLVMRAALRRAGHEVRLAGSGERALEEFRREPCDMVMLDVEMPGLAGLDVCRILRAEAGPLLPIVMVTGMDDVASVAAAFECGATDFIAKPVHWALIGHRVRGLLHSHRAMHELRRAQARNAAILDAMPDLMFELDIDGRYLDYRVPRAQRDATPAPLGRTVFDVMPAQAAQRCMDSLRAALACGWSAGQPIELPLDGASRWFELSVSRQDAGPQAGARFIVLARDITERKEIEARTSRAALFDALTGLPNRSSFIERVDREIARAGLKGDQMALLCLDLDGFKNINDTMGHAAGDRILQWAATRLRDGLRPSDMLARSQTRDDEGEDTGQLARLGGDEFTALLLQLDRPESALAVAQRVCDIMRAPFVIEAREVRLSASIGIAIYPQDGLDGATLLRHADTAMYQAKRSGRDNAQLYNESLTRDIVRRMELDTSLRLALERQEFHLVYQPQIDVASGRMLSVEALIRWTHPVRGPVPPLEFIARAEENGQIQGIGHWVLLHACADAARWNRAGPPVKLAINLSPIQFGSPGLAQAVIDALTATGLAPELLELEVTEGALMDDTDATRATLQRLHEHGVRIALDDFGTGYSSLAYLTRMPISHIKIDRAFVAGMFAGGESEAIIRAVLAMASSLGMRATAEGVETLAQAQLLQAMACDSVQGFYFSRPVLADHIPSLLIQRWALQDARPSGFTLLASARV